MTQLILMFAALVAVLVLPVMFAARMVGAERTGFGAAFIAVILQIVLSGLVEQFATNQLIAVVIAIIGGSAIYSFTLSTTLLKGLFISIIATIIAVVAIVLLAGSSAIIAGVA